MHILDVAVHAGNRLAHAIRNRDRVRLRLTHNTKADDAAAVETNIRGRVGWRKIDFGYVAQPHVLAQAQRRCLCRCRHRGIGAHAHFLVDRLEAAGRHVGTRRLQCVGDVVHRQAVTGKSSRVDAHPHHLFAIAEHRDVGDTVDRRQFRLDPVFDQPGQFIDRQCIAGDRQAHDRLRIVVGLDDGQSFDTFWQIALDAADRFADVVGGIVEIDVGPELDIHTQGVFFAR